MVTIVADGVAIATYWKGQRLEVGAPHGVLPGRIRAATVTDGRMKQAMR